MSKRIAVMILGPLGDVINTSGVFKHLRHSFPDAKISIITIDKALAAVRGIPEIDNIYSYSKKKSFVETFKFGMSLRGKFDTVVVLDNSLRSAYLAFFTGAKRRIGRGEQLRELFLTDVIPYLDEEKQMKIHVSEHYARCLNPLGIYREGLETYFNFNKEDNDRVIEILKSEGLENKKLLGICPACHLESKSLQAADLAAIIKKINNKDIYKPVIIGGSDISEMVSELREFSNIEYYDFTGKTKFLETAALIDKCDKFLSVDTSCMHLALARKVPTTGIFFTNLFEKWGPKDLRNNNLYVNMESKQVDIDEIIKQVECLPEKSAFKSL